MKKILFFVTAMSLAVSPMVAANVQATEVVKSKVETRDWHEAQNYRFFYYQPNNFGGGPVDGGGGGGSSGRSS